MNNLSLFHHIYIDNKSSQTLVLLHGTGGDENNFLFLDEPLNKKFNLLGLRGNVNENGQIRFFKRYSLTEYDQDNIREETEKLDRFITQWKEEHPTSTELMAFLGYSNGANMLVAMLHYYPQLVTNAVLLHALQPIQPTQKIDLSEHRIFFSYGSNDELIPPDMSKTAIDTLQAYGASVEVHEYMRGHEICREEVLDAAEFLNGLTQ